MFRKKSIKTVAEAPAEDTVAASKEHEDGESIILQQKQQVIRFLIKLGAAIIVVCAVFTFVFGIRQVSGESMYPRLRDGDLTLFYRLEGDYQVGDVVTFKIDGVTCWGRIAAQGGDSISIYDDGQIVVNDNVQQQEIFYTTLPQDDGVTYPYTVPEDSYFIMCDYRTACVDSRTYGAVSKSDLDGKVITVLRRRSI